MISKLKYIAILAAFTVIFSCSNAELNLAKADIPTLNKVIESLNNEAKKCDETPTESAGSYPNKPFSNLVRSDITDGKNGMELNIELIIEYKGRVLENASVDIWHCDSHGDFSQYGSFASSNFLRGRQLTDAAGKVSFKTIFPGWIENRAVHIYVAIKMNDATIKVTQIALTQDMQDKVFATSGYKGLSSTKNKDDIAFSNSLVCNLPDKIFGDLEYIIRKKIIIK